MEGRILKIAYMGQPILQKPAEPVKTYNDSQIVQLIKDMEATVQYMNCSGLAAPQIFVPLRVVIFRVLTKTSNPAYELTPEYDPDGVPWTVMINPRVTPLSNKMTLGWEQCLSLPGLMGRVSRYHSIEYQFINKNGHEEKRTAHGFHARVVQHECDHLEGILYPTKIQNMKDFGFADEILKSWG